MKLLQRGVLSRQIAERYRGDRSPQADEGIIRASWTTSCDRELWYLMQREQYTNPPSAIVQNKLTKGDRYHLWLQQELVPKYTGYDLAHVEDTLDATWGKVRIRGHIDGVLVERKTGKKIALMDFKTTSEYGYKGSAKALGSGGDPGHYSWKYYTQLNRYLNAWNKTYPKEKLDTVVIFLYNVNGSEDKDTGFCSNDYWIKPSLVDFKIDLARLSAVGEAKREPERGYRSQGWECKGCWYNQKCWGEEAQAAGAA